MVRVLRWIAVLPGAAGGAWLAWFVFGFINRISLLFVGILPTSFIGRGYVELMSSLAMGAVLVYAGSRIAPAYQHRAAFALAGLGLLMAGAFLTFALMASDYWAVWSTAWLAVGIATMAYTEIIDETRQAAGAMKVRSGHR